MNLEESVKEGHVYVMCEGYNRRDLHRTVARREEVKYDQKGQQLPYTCDGCQKEYLRQIREGERTGL